MGFILTAVAVYALAALGLGYVIKRQIQRIPSQLVRRIFGSAAIGALFAPTVVGFSHAGLPFPALLFLCLEAIRLVVNPLAPSDAGSILTAIKSIVISGLIVFPFSFIPTSKYNCRKCSSWMKNKSESGLCDFCENRSDA